MWAVTINAGAALSWTGTASARYTHPLGDRLFDCESLRDMTMKERSGHEEGGDEADH